MHFKKKPILARSFKRSIELAGFLFDSQAHQIKKPANSLNIIYRNKVTLPFNLIGRRGLRWSRYPDLAEELGVDWNEESWRKRTQSDKDGLPLHDIDITKARS